MQLQLEGATLWPFKLESEPKKITAIEEGNLARRPWAISVYIRETSGFHVNVFGKYPRYFFKHRKTPSNAERLEPHFMGDSPEWGKLQNFPQRCGTPSLQGKKNGWAPKREAFQVVNGHCSTTCRTRKKKHLADKEVACLTTNLENSNDYLFTTTFQKRWGKTLTTRVVGLQYLVSSGRL